MNQARFLSFIAGFLVLLIAMLLALVWLVDPFQIYHKPIFSGQLLSENQRYQNAGLINNYLADPQRSYDSAAFGTSASVNFTESAIEKKLGWKKTLRLFLPGGSPSEIRQTIVRALSKRKIKHLLLETDLWIMNGEHRPVDNSSFPLYLYNESRIDDAKYFVDFEVILETMKFLFGIADTRNGTSEMLGYWADGSWVTEQHKGLNVPEHIAALATEHLSVTALPEEKIAALHYPALDNEMIPLLKSLCNSDIEVVLFVPPYSRLYFMEKQNDIDSVIYEPRYLLNSIASCKNIRLHAFDTMPFTSNLNNYKDHRHFLLHVSNQLLDWMSQHQHILTRDSIADYERQWIDSLNRTTITSTYPDEPRL